MFGKVGISGYRKQFVVTLYQGPGDKNWRCIINTGRSVLSYVMYNTGGFFRLSVKNITQGAGAGTGHCVVYKKWGKITSRLPEGTSLAHSLEMHL